MPTEKTWQQWLERFYNLRRDKRGSHKRPHKPVLLLAIFDLLDHGLLKKNEIPPSPDLVKTFQRYFEVVRQCDDQPSIENPFYHLSSDGFWHLVPKLGELGQLRSNKLTGMHGPTAGQTQGYNRQFPRCRQISE
jgi:putative restriction endonuclease